MTIQQCRYVLKISQTGSFNEAANQLFIAQSTLSLSVKALEKELGIKIFQRLRNGVCLTDEGVEFVNYASKICDQADLVTERYEENRVYERLSVATQHYDFIADIFAKLINQTKSESYKFALKEIKTHDVINEVKTAMSNIGIIAIKHSDYDTMKRYLNTKGLVFTEFLKAYPHVFLRKDHPLATKEKLSINDLTDYPYVLYEQGQHGSSFFTEELIDESFSEKEIEISDRATLMNVLLTTNAYTIGTGIMPSALNEGKQIVSIPLESDEHYIIGYILNGEISGERSISNSTRRFIELLIENTKNI